MIRSAEGRVMAVRLAAVQCALLATSLLSFPFRDNRRTGRAIHRNVLHTAVTAYPSLTQGLSPDAISRVAYAKASADPSRRPRTPLSDNSMFQFRFMGDGKRRLTCTILGIVHNHLSANIIACRSYRCTADVCPFAERAVQLGSIGLEEVWDGEVGFGQCQCGHAGVMQLVGQHVSHINLLRCCDYAAQGCQTLRSRPAEL